MSTTLVIVESPAKARTISRFLKGKTADEVIVEASMGHIRDLPRSASEIPAKYRDEAWARLGVDYENGFEPIYVVTKDRRNQVKKLKGLVKESDAVYLATDEDREGESIAWHLTQILEPKVPVHRMVFHEITESAIREAFENPRSIDERLVDAQEARRILDRLYGYEVSPVLWRKVSQGLSAGRVQSVAVRIVVERERERMAFRSATFWDIAATFEKGGAAFPGTLVDVDGSRVASGRDFDSTGNLTTDALALDEAAATDLAQSLTGRRFTVDRTETKPYRRSPYAPFRTSTLQQEAGRKLRFTSKRTMSVAQRLYENGYITYMRTDSVTLAASAIATARSEIEKLYGSGYLPKTPRVYSGKVKNAQEAHEAIRPAGEAWKTPAQVAVEVGGDEAALYDLIWRRTIASQMPDATGETVAVRISATTDDGTRAEFASSGRVITFPGFLKAYVESHDDESDDDDDAEKILPPLAEGDEVGVEELRPNGHETKAPARFTEASLVRRLEELGVGRPSTYASILTTIQDRGYVWKRGSALVPSFTAFAVVSLLEANFPDLVSYAFTANMEDDLDRISTGDESRTPWLERFYLGDTGLKAIVSERLDDIDARAVNSIPIGVDKNGEEILARVGRYGPYLERGTDRASLPDDIAPDELTVETAVEMLEQQSAGDKILGTDPDTSMVVLLKRGRFGPYVQLGEDEEGAKTKPKRASLLKSMEPDELSLDAALQLLSLPRTVGEDADGVDVLALNGRYGPYIQRGDDRRSLESEDQLFTLTLDEAIALLAEPPRRRGQRRSAEPLKSLGDDPVSKKPVTVRTGRYGPYVTDGDVNASLRKGDDPENITLERAAELLAARRERLAQ